MGASSALTIGTPSFQDSEHCWCLGPLWGCPKELPGSEEKEEFGVWAAGPVDKAGPLGPRAGLCCPYAWRVPSPEARGLFPGREGGAPVLSPRRESVP